MELLFIKNFRCIFWFEPCTVVQLILYNFALITLSTLVQLPWIQREFFFSWWKFFFYTEEGSISGTPEISSPVGLDSSLSGGTGFLHYQRLEKFLMTIKIIFLQQCTAVFLRFIYLFKKIFIWLFSILKINQGVSCLIYFFALCWFCTVTALRDDVFSALLSVLVKCGTQATSPSYIATCLTIYDFA